MSVSNCYGWNYKQFIEYGNFYGDVDFYLSPEKYKKLKPEMHKCKKVKGVRVFDRSDLDMIELCDPDVDALGYVSTEKMCEAVRVKLSEHTKI